MPGREPGVGGFGENAGTAGKEEGGGGTPAEAAAGGAAMTRVVSFFGLAVAGAMRMVCPLATSSEGAASPEAAAGGGAGLKRTVSRFTTGGSLGLEGSVMRTVSFLGFSTNGGGGGGVLEAGVSEGVSSAIMGSYYLYVIAAF